MAILSPKVVTSQYMDFHLIQKKPKTNVWAVMNKSGGYRLGVIQWYAPWRQYCFMPEGETLVFSRRCLKDLADFIANDAGFPYMEVANGN